MRARGPRLGSSWGHSSSHQGTGASSPLYRSLPFPPFFFQAHQSPPHPVPLCMCVWRGEVSTGPLAPLGSRVEGLFPDSPEPYRRPRASRSPALSTSCQIPAAGVKGTLSNLWNFSVRNKHVGIPCRPPAPGMLPAARSRGFLNRHLGALGDFQCLFSPPAGGTVGHHYSEVMEPCPAASTGG